MYISIDVGGTNTRVANATNLDRPVFLDKPLRQRNVHDFEKDLGFIIDAALQLARGEQIDAVGIGTPGSPNKDKTQVKSANNLSSWANKPLVDSLLQALNAPVFYDNDVVAAGLGEAYYGQAKGDFDYIIWGTGIGGGSIHRKCSKPEVTLLDWHSYFGDWEKTSGGSELTKRFGKPPEDFTATEWDVVAKQFKRHLEGYLANRQPSAIVFGGGLAVKHAQLLEEIGHNFGSKINVTKFGIDSGLVGGLGLIRQGLEEAPPTRQT